MSADFSRRLPGPKVSLPQRIVERLTGEERNKPLCINPAKMINERLYAFTLDFCISFQR
jgi:hypothetical protein